MIINRVVNATLFLKNIKMAINVNTVYTTVLSIINKEQRGYLTPDEFNKLATQVQLEIFEKFFEDYNQFLRMPKTDEEFASRVDHVLEEFQVFEKTESASQAANNVYTQPTDLHRFGSVTYTKAVGQPPIQVLTSREYREQILSPLLQPSMTFPVAKYQQDKITVFPPLSSFDKSDVSFNYIRKPKDVRWGYTVGNLGQYIYNDTEFNTTSLAVGDITAQTSFNSANATAGTYSASQGSGQADVAYLSASGPGGTGAAFTVNIVGSGTISLSSTTTSVSITSVGSGYQVGDRFVFNTNSFITGLSAVVTATITSVNFMNATGQGSIQFEISESQQVDAVLGILKYAGIIIKDTQIIQAASGLQTLDEQNSKKIKYGFNRSNIFRILHWRNSLYA